MGSIACEHQLICHLCIDLFQGTQPGQGGSYRPISHSLLISRVDLTVKANSIDISSRIGNPGCLYRVDLPRNKFLMGVRVLRLPATRQTCNDEHRKSQTTKSCFHEHYLLMVFLKPNIKCDGESLVSCCFFLLAVLLVHVEYLEVILIPKSESTENLSCAEKQGSIQ